MHWRTTSYGFIHLDDTQLILGDLPFLQAHNLSAAFQRSFFPNPSDTYYRPLVTVSFMADAHCFGADPRGYHLTNVLLHALATTLVFRTARAFELPLKVAAVAALCFAVHPVHVAAVAWIPGRGDILLTCFVLVACWAWVRDSPIVHSVAFALALCTKETAWILPLIVACLPRPRRLRASVVASVGVAAACAALRFAALRHQHAAVPLDIALALRHAPTLLGDLGKLLFGAPLQVLAAAEDVKIWPGVVAVGVAFFVPRARYWRWCVALVVLPLVLGLLASRAAILESRLYLPSVGVCVAVAALALQGRRVLLPVLGAALGFFVYASVRQSRHYENRDAFAQAAVEQSPHSGVAFDLMRRRFMPEGR
ncbi:MAG: hypothetical protein QM756_08535 [Polyangiaceae bacterium]